MLSIIHRLRSHVLNTVHRVGERIQQVLKPDTVSKLAGAAKDAVCSKGQLIAVNALLRQQMIIVQRQVKHSRLSNRDRFRLLLLARATPFWKQALLIVQADPSTAHSCAAESGIAADGQDLCLPRARRPAPRLSPCRLSAEFTV